MGAKSVSEEPMGEKSEGKKYMGGKSVGEKAAGEKSAGELGVWGLKVCVCEMSLGESIWLNSQ